MPTANLRMALLIDGDNAQSSLIQPILEALANYGQCVIRRVYGDWTAANMSSWRKVEETYAIQLVQQSRYASGKNANDIAITVAAMEIMQSGKVNAFCIVSSDSDFTPLVMRLKDAGATVIAVGKPTTPPSFINACTRFISTDTLNGAHQASAADTPRKPQKSAESAANSVSPAKAATSTIAKPPNARPLLQKAYEMANKPDEWLHLAELGHYLRQLDPQFKPQTYGQKGLSQLTAQYKDLFELRTEDGEGNSAHTYVRLKKRKR